MRALLLSRPALSADEQTHEHKCISLTHLHSIFFALFSVAVEKRYAMLTFFLEDALQLAIQLYVLLVARQGFTTVTAFTLGGTMVGASMAAYRASKLVAYAIL